LRRIAAALAGTVAVAAGFVAWAMHRPVLVVYASRAGSTGEVAQAISERLCGMGFDAEVRPVETVSSLVGFEAVVLGSAVRYGTWLPETKRFIESHRSELAQLPLALFTVHMGALGGDAASQATRAGYTKAVRAGLKPRDEAFFAGKIDLARLSFFERMAVKLAKSPLGDMRDWDRIRRWADGLGEKLQ
jgi:menaquinone-dependent protoporphyrinogen oxidase